MSKSSENTKLKAMIKLAEQANEWISSTAGKRQLTNTFNAARQITMQHSKTQLVDSQTLHEHFTV